VNRGRGRGGDRIKARARAYPYPYPYPYPLPLISHLGGGMLRIVNNTAACAMEPLEE